MRYLYAAVLAVVFIGGGVLGYRLAPRPGVREVPGPTVETETEKVVTRTVAGDVTTRYIERKAVKPAAVTPQAKPQYRLGALIPVGDYKDVTVTAGRRIVGGLWGGTQFNLKRKEVLVGLEYEF